MTDNNDLIHGNLLKGMIRFSIPYLISCFLQTFYGLADLFITGQFNGAGVVSAVAIGSQLMHMLTVVIVGLAMGTTVTISRAVGAGKLRDAEKYIGNSITVFIIFAAILTAILTQCRSIVLSWLSTPSEAFSPAMDYSLICFLGIPFITAYNVISSIFRGLGNTRRPMIFVAIAGIINVGLDYLLIGPYQMGAAGAALATVVSQAISVVLAIISLIKFDAGIHFRLPDLKISKEYSYDLLGIGAPISFQDGLIQISFLVITTIANSRGVQVAAAVGIVEKIISFLFLVPSAMLSTVSAVSAQNIGAGNHARSRQVLTYGIRICIVFGIFIFFVCQFLAPDILALFVKNEPVVVELGAQYLRTYILDCVFAGIHFCFSGFFSAHGKSIYSFIHNILSIALVRIPGAYLASVFFPATLYAMGLATALGSLLSVIICVFIYKSREW